MYAFIYACISDLYEEKILSLISNNKKILVILNKYRNIDRRNVFFKFKKVLNNTRFAANNWSVLLLVSILEQTI